MRPLRILTWHVHGNYLWYLSNIRHEIYLPVAKDRPGYGGRGTTFPFRSNVIDIPAENVRATEFDCIIYQHRQNYVEDRLEILSPEHLKLPQVAIEHDPPQEHPTNTKHYVDDPNVLLVHVTAFNRLMWDSGRTPSCVIEHGVPSPKYARYTGEIERGIVVINHLRDRGRRLGVDVFEQLRQDVPLDLVGMQSEELGGIGEVPPPELALFEARYRFFLNPIRYTSLGLAVIEAMLLGMPILGLATTEMVTTIENGVSGYLETDPLKLIPYMEELLRDPTEARRLGDNARRYAEERFAIDRFVKDWHRALQDVTGVPATA